MHIETSVVHTGVKKDPGYNSVTTPIYTTSTFAFDDINTNKGYDYTRSGNPTRTALQENLAALEGGMMAWATCTGMAAATTAMFLFKRGDHIIASSDLYGGTYRLFMEGFEAFGLEFSFVDMRDPENIRKALQRNTNGIWIETPSNPLLNIVDLEETMKIAKERGLYTICDNTFLSPYFQSPFDYGVDVIIHSTTKYINGHSDVVGGAIMVNTETMARRMNYMVNTLGTACSPFDAWLVLRGVKTLPQRMEAHQRGAMVVAEYLENHDLVRKTFYPGLKSHEQHELAKRQMKGFGGMVTFVLDLHKADIFTFFDSITLFTLAESLGGVESLIEHPWTMSHASMPEPARLEAGLSPAAVRLSIGIEHPDDLIEALEKALEKAKYRVYSK